MADEALVVQEEQRVEQPEQIVHLVARNPVEMAKAKGDLQTWLEKKVAAMTAEGKELEAARNHAKKSKWNYAALAKHAALTLKRVEFYKKALTAVQAGYTLVPNFPVDVFAIRVKRHTPPNSLANDSTSQWSGQRPTHDPRPEALPVGEGRYVSGSLVGGRSGEYKDKNSKGEEITKYFFHPTDFAEVTFPMEAARVEVMSAASEAMAMKCFDSLGICPQTRKGDPLIIGKVLGPKIGYTQREISFLIAWHLNLTTL